MAPKVPRWYSRLSLRTKATGMTVAVTTAALAVVAATGLLQMRGQIAAEQHRAADSVALGFARAAELALAVRDTRELARLSNSFLRDPNVLFIAVFAGDGPSGRSGPPGAVGRPLASAIRDAGAWDAFVRGRADGERCVLGERQLEQAAAGNEFADDAGMDPSSGDGFGAAGGAPGTVPKSPARPAGSPGRVVVGISTAPAALAQAEQTRVTAAATAGAAAVGSLVLFLALGTWMRRLHRLGAASQSLSRGDFETAVADGHDDEIGRLADSFDAMRLALRERDLRLRTFNDTLQEQVKQRTHALELALTAAEEANRAKSLFLANMSHELRTPLNGVIGMVDLLLANGPSAQQRRYCDVAKSSARSLLELINDILDFSKIEAGKLELDATDFDPHEVVEGVAQMLGGHAERKKLELACGVGPGVPRNVGGDPVRLRQVVVNLVTNAIKFTERGEVVVRAELEGETASHAVVRFSVRDSGIGIPPDRLGRLFKSFSQVDASTTRKFGGTGLGLAISQRLVELMGGRIGVESREGQGTTFWFTARFEKRQGTAPGGGAGARGANGRGATSASGDLLGLRGLRALAVDDNPANREILHAQLASWSLRAEVAGGAGQALQMLRAAAVGGEPYRFAILDMHMPDTDGAELASQIKADPLTRDVILISLSSISDPIEPRFKGSLGFAACLTKPALPSQLYNAIVDSLAASAARGAPKDATPASAGAAAAAGPAAEASGEGEGAPPRLDGVRVLLAEDNEINRLVASELLAQAGCHCTIVVNGREALDTVLCHPNDPPDVILMDCQMPEMDGFEATRRIREAEKAAAGAGKPLHRLIIALTANAIKGDRELCLGAGMDGYVTKPIDPMDLLGTIRSMLPPGHRALAAPQPSAPRESAPEGSPAAAPPLAATQTADAPNAGHSGGTSGTATNPAGASAPDTSPPVDLPSLRQRCLGNRKLAAKALSRFDGSVSQDVAALADGVGKADAPSVAASAHKIKGAAANVSAEGVRRVAAELERLARADEMAQTRACLDQLQCEMDRFRGYLSTALAELSPALPAEGAAAAPLPRA